MQGARLDSLNSGSPDANRILDSPGLQRMRDGYMSQMMELNKSKPRGKESEVLLAEITRLESALTVARDDLVIVMTLLPVGYDTELHCCRAHVKIAWTE